MLMFLPRFGDDSEHRSRFFLKYHHKTPHVYGHKSPVKYFEENSQNSSLFKFPTKTYPWNMSLFNKNCNVIFQVDPHKQPLEAAS